VLDGRAIEMIKRIDNLEKEIRDLKRQNEMFVLRITHDCNLIQEHEVRLLRMDAWIKGHTDDCK